MSRTIRLRRQRRNSFTALDKLLNALPEASILGIYYTDVGVQNSGGFVDSFDDCRGASGFGPSLVNTLTARPAWDNVGKLINFDGVNDFLRGANFPGGTFNDHTFMVVGTVPLTVTNTVYGMTSIGAATTGLQLDWQNTPSIRAVSAGPFAVFPAPGAGLRAIIGRLLRVGGNGTAGIQIGNAAEVTSTSAIGNAACDTVTIGATRATASFGLFSLRAVVLLREASGAYNAALSAFATSLGAV